MRFSDIFYSGKQIHLLVALVALALFFSAPASVMAKNTPETKPVPSAGDPLKFAVVDVQMLLTESLGAENIQKQLEKHRESYQKEFSEYERELRNSEQALTEQRAGLAPEEFSKKREEFEEKLLDTRRLVQKRKQSLDKAYTEAMNKLRGEMLRIVAEMADENGYDLVLSRQNVVIVAKEHDITDDVMVRLNKDLPKISVKVE